MDILRLLLGEIPSFEKEDDSSFRKAKIVTTTKTTTATPGHKTWVEEKAEEGTYHVMSLSSL